MHGRVRLYRVTQAQVVSELMGCDIVQVRLGDAVFELDQSAALGDVTTREAERSATDHRGLAADRR